MARSRTVTAEIWDEGAAAAYDGAAAGMYAPEVLGPTVDFLAALAPGGRALEFAVGTGRVALALSERGVTLAGIDYSRPMVDVLRGKPGSDRVEVVVGDMASAAIPGSFDLVYVVFNSISNLLTQAEQVACFRNAARHLRTGGHFVVELEVPDLRRLPVGALAQVFRVADDGVSFDTFDLAAQRLVSHHYTVKDGKGHIFRSPHRFIWPSEMDLMGELAGMRLVERWADWSRSPFTADSDSHISVWEKP
ncbi:class I SAM-dependent methyltransferase [Micromonospora sp. CPCC 205371]|nr:class I SAM-dependent methyltransferase [Micromonospora sp. CPCC 205371]